MPDLAAIVRLGTEPIPGPAPGGASARYEPEYEALENEIGKTLRVTDDAAARRVDWLEARRLAALVLAEKSKDLLVAVYLAKACRETDGWAGLAVGLRICCDLVTRFWETMFPEVGRPRARIGSLRWLLDRLKEDVSSAPAPSESDRPSIEECEQRLREIADIATQRLDETESAPSDRVSASARAVAELVRGCLAAIPLPDPASPDPASESTSTVSNEPPAAGPATMDSPESAWEAVRQTRDVLRRASRLLRQQNADDPSAYHLLRESLWSDVGDPPQQEQGKTSLAGGDAEFARELENLIACGRSREAIARAEDRLCEEPYWLDLSFVSYRAMEDLGRSFAAARRAIGNDVAALLRRAPWIATLRFSSGVPFTSERTLLWVSNELHAGPRDKSRTPEDPLRELAERARVHVARGQLAEATALIEQELRAASHRRERFRWRLLLAKLCRESGRPTLALPQLRALDEEAAKYFVEEWEPSLVIELLKEMWYTSQALSLTEDVTRLHARLCRLDLSAAMAMDGQTP